MASVVPRSFKQAFDGKHHELAATLDAKNGLLILLEDQRILTRQQLETLQEEPSYRCNVAMLKYLEKAPDEKLAAFHSILVETNQGHVWYDIILGESEVKGSNCGGGTENAFQNSVDMIAANELAEVDQEQMGNTASVESIAERRMDLLMQEAFTKSRFQVDNGKHEISALKEVFTEKKCELRLAETQLAALEEQTKAQRMLVVKLRNNVAGLRQRIESREDALDKLQSDTKEQRSVFYGTHVRDGLHCVSHAELRALGYNICELPPVDNQS